MQVVADDIPAVASLVRELCGITLDASKTYLIESPLSRLAQEFGVIFCRNVAIYLDAEACSCG
jgi:chemotaxis methyl-accepting protein methylase